MGGETGREDLRLLMVAGEFSGDRYGEQLIRAISAECGEMECFGIGGDLMARAGFQRHYDSRDLAVVGLVEVISRLPLYSRALRDLRRLAEKRRPDLAILIDYPDFNFRLARHLKRLQIPVLYFISPQVWAWRRSRVRTIAARIDAMAVILPFEEEIYRSEGVPVEYVGHPLIDLAVPSCPVEESRRRFGLRSGSPVVGLLPGSRIDECRRLLPVLLTAARILHGKNPSIQFLLPLASTLPRAEVDREIRRHGVPVTLVEGRYYDALNVCDAAAIASGTATLEAALLQVPMVVVYRVHPLTYWIGSRMATVDKIGLVNLVAGRKVVPELVQRDCTPGGIARELERFLAGPELCEKIRNDLAGVKEKLGQGGAFARTAAIAMRLLPARLVTPPRAAGVGAGP